MNLNLTIWIVRNGNKVCAKYLSKVEAEAFAEKLRFTKRRAIEVIEAKTTIEI